MEKTVIYLVLSVCKCFIMCLAYFFNVSCGGATASKHWANPSKRRSFTFLEVAVWTPNSIVQNCSKKRKWKDHLHRFLAESSSKLVTFLCVTVFFWKQLIYNPIKANRFLSFLLSLNHKIVWTIGIPAVFCRIRNVRKNLQKKVPEIEEEIRRPVTTIVHLYCINIVPSVPQVFLATDLHAVSVTAHQPTLNPPLGGRRRIHKSLNTWQTTAVRWIFLKTIAPCCKAKHFQTSICPGKLAVV